MRAPVFRESRGGEPCAKVASGQCCKIKSHVDVLDDDALCYGRFTQEQVGDNCCGENNTFTNLYVCVLTDVSHLLPRREGRGQLSAHLSRSTDPSSCGTTKGKDILSAVGI